MRKLTIVMLTAIPLLVAVSCEKLLPGAPDADEVMDAPLSGLTGAQNGLFLKGAEEFDEVYTTATGLGPVFVATSCASCHSGDNRGHMFTVLTRFGQSDTHGNNFMEMGGPQLQNRAIFGHSPEEIPAGATSSKFLAPIAAGVGFIELVSDADILSMADPNDLDGDGISGVPNWNSIPSWVKVMPGAVQMNGKFICRFGRKASTYNLHQQTVGAFNQDMGITSTFNPVNPYNYKTQNGPVADSEPEVTDESIAATVFYLQVLQTPIQRNQGSAQVKWGREVFINAGCEKCHKETLKTGFSPVEALSRKEFHPFTDLLLHDMGPELDDQYTEGSALTSEWRTTPLWGLGLAPASQGKQYFLLHDGRARTIEQAIEYHGGEGSASRDAFRNLNKNDRDALIAFLESI